MANLILSIFERVITILMFIALAVALVCKKKSKKVPLFIIRPIFFGWLVIYHVSGSICAAKFYLAG